MDVRSLENELSTLKAINNDIKNLQQFYHQLPNRSTLVLRTGHHKNAGYREGNVAALTYH